MKTPVKGIRTHTHTPTRIIDMASFGYYFKRLRKEQGISLRNLEKEVGISHNTLAFYKRERTVPSVENGFAIAAYFHLPLEYFLKGEAVISDFRDATLRELCRHVDEMNDEDRDCQRLPFTIASKPSRTKQPSERSVR